MGKNEKKKGIYISLLSSKIEPKQSLFYDETLNLKCVSVKVFHVVFPVLFVFQKIPISDLIHHRSFHA